MHRAALVVDEAAELPEDVYANGLDTRREEGLFFK